MSTQTLKPKNTPSKLRLTVLSALLLLSLAAAMRFSFVVKYADFYYAQSEIGSLSDLALQAVPKEVKSFIAAVLRLTADEYMHLGPTKKVKQNFVAGAFAGNTELIAMLNLSLVFEPTHMESYENISHNMALYVRHFKDAIHLLQRGILLNRDSAELHKLYAAGAFCYGFFKKYTFASPNQVRQHRKIALNYIDKAIEAYLKHYDEINKNGLFNDFANLENYYALKCRFLVDIGERKKALETWQNAPVIRKSALLWYYLELVKTHSYLPRLPEDLVKPQNRVFLLQSFIKAPYNLPNISKYWFCSSKDLYSLQAYAYGFNLANNVIKETEEHKNEQYKTTKKSKECSAPDCPVHHHHHHHHHNGDCSDPNCPLCTQAKQEGTASAIERIMRRSIITLVLSAVILWLMHKTPSQNRRNLTPA